MTKYIVLFSFNGKGRGRACYLNREGLLYIAGSRAATIMPRGKARAAVKRMQRYRRTRFKHDPESSEFQLMPVREEE